MIQILRALIVVAVAIIFISCKKNDTNPGSALYGRWINSSDTVDTLQFMRKNNKDILRYNMSFNTVMPAYSEVEYTYKDGRLSCKLYASTSNDYYPITSFRWKRTGGEFEIQAIQLFPI